MMSKTSPTPQMSFSDMEYRPKKGQTRREKFLSLMEQLIPWADIGSEIMPYYPKGQTGRPPYPLAVMIRIYCLQLFDHLGDQAMEDALYENLVMRRFVGLSLSDKSPDETTILNFRHLMEEHRLGKKLFDTILKSLSAKGLVLKRGTIVDSTIIRAPTSTKNQAGKRDDEMSSTRKGDGYHFGLKAHIGVDADSGVTHTLKTTTAKVADINAVEGLLHGEEEKVWGDAGYVGIQKRKEHKKRKVDWHINRRRTQALQFEKDSEERKQEREKSSIRAKVEHPFRYIKCVFGFSKTSYRGLLKNEERLYALLAFANLLRCKQALLA